MLLSKAVVILIYLPLLFWGMMHIVIAVDPVYGWGNSIRLAIWVEATAVGVWGILWMVETWVEPRVAWRFPKMGAVLVKYASAGVGGSIAALILFFQFFKESSFLAVVPAFAIYMLLFVCGLFAAFQYLMQQNATLVSLTRSYQDAQYAALKAWLNPHFLFNTLNLISDEIEHDPDHANSLLEDFSELLRGMLKAWSQQKVLLVQEVTLLRHYLTLQQSRFGPRFEFSLHVPQTCEAFLVPPLLLLTFIEHAIMDGMTSSQQRLSVIIEVHQESTQLQWRLWIPENKGTLQNLLAASEITLIRDMLSLLYGDRQSLSIKLTAHDGLNVKIFIPLEKL